MGKKGMSNIGKKGMFNNVGKRRKMSNLPKDDISPGPADPDEADIMLTHIFRHRPADQKKEPQKGPENAKEALDDILSGKKGISALFDEKTRYFLFRQEVLNLTLDYVDYIRKYNGIDKETWGSMVSRKIEAPAAQPEYRERISARAREAGIPEWLLNDLRSSRASMTDIEFGYMDIAVKILAKEKKYDSIFAIAEGCVNEAQKRGIGVGPDYLSKAAAILLAHPELRSNHAYSSLVYEMKVLAEEFRYTGIVQDLK